MSESEHDRGTVRLDTGEVASNHPQFIVAANGKYYLTLALWEYDQAQERLTPEQRAGVAEIADLFTRLRNAGWEHSAVQVTPRRGERRSATHQHTYPES